MKIHGGDNAHVALAPLSSAVRHLVFEDFEGIQAKFWLRNLERLAEDIGGFVLHHEEITMGFVLADLLHDAEVVDEGVEVAAGEVSYWFVGEGIDGVSELVHFGTGWRCGS